MGYNQIMKERPVPRRLADPQRTLAEDGNDNMPVRLMTSELVLIQHWAVNIREEGLSPELLGPVTKATTHQSNSQAINSPDSEGNTQLLHL